MGSVSSEGARDGRAVGVLGRRRAVRGDQDVAAAVPVQERDASRGGGPALKGVSYAPLDARRAMLRPAAVSKNGLPQRSERGTQAVHWTLAGYMLRPAAVSQAGLPQRSVRGTQAVPQVLGGEIYPEDGWL
eukprot:1181623-Prorocentrum_minimum.AAC.4